MSRNGTSPPSWGQSSIQSKMGQFGPIAENNTSPVIVIAGDGTVSYANAASWLILKQWKSDVGKTIPEPWRTVVSDVQESGATHERALVVGMVAYELLFVPSDNDMVFVFGADITEVRQSNRDRQIKAHIYMQVREAIVVMDDEFRTIDANPAYLSFVGLAEAAVLGEVPGFLLRARHEEELYDEIVHSLGDSGVWQGEIVERGADRTARTIHVSITAVSEQGDSVSHYIAMVSDVTVQRAAEAQLQRMAHFDGLTGLPNRQLFSDHVQSALTHSRRTGERFAVMLVDLDGFKSINDTFGHRSGDRLLQKAAAAMDQAVRTSDTVARFGGDEFAVLVRDIKTSDAGVIVAKKLLDAVSQTVTIDGNEVYVTASIGIAAFPSDGTDTETLLRRADLAMYRVKRSHKNDFSYAAEDVQQGVARNLQIQTRLRRALAEGVVRVAYQPQFHPVSGELVGIEALARWHDAVLGDVEPVEFVDIAETFGLINELGELVLRDACRQGAEWVQAYSRPVRLAVNVSARQLRHREFCPMLERVLSDTGFPPSLLELELTETIFVGDVESLAQVFEQLAEYGVALCIDDFGTRYASLMYIKQFPISHIKIDRSFIRDIPDDVSSAKLVGAIISMAHSLGCEVTAEGVETVAQAQFLARSGCHELQGYLCGRPAEPAELAHVFTFGCTEIAGVQ